MNLEVSFKNLRPRDEIRGRAQALTKKLERFLGPSAEGTLVVGVEHDDAVLELVIHSGGETHKVTEEHSDLRTALDKVFHTAEGQLRRAKQRRALPRRERAEPEDGFVADV